jgi:hypothetical protein
MRGVVLVLIILAVALASGCIGQYNSNAMSGITDTLASQTAEIAKQKCPQECQIKKAVLGDLSSGPCISDNNERWSYTDWVCDVAHNPREAVDNEAANQCGDFRSGKAHHFVEVDPECNFIRAV